MSSPLWSAFTLSALRQLFKPQNYSAGKRLQERADLMKLFLLTGAREAWPEPPVVKDVDSLPPLKEQRTTVESRVRLQALTLLESWHKERPPPLPPESPRAPIDAATRAALEAERAAEAAAAQRRAFGFELSVAPSSAGAEAGDGVRLDGRALPGSVVAFYPGVTYEVHDVIALPGGTNAFAGNEYLMARHDRAIVDGSKSALELLPAEALFNPLSVAHRVNHPPRGALPNVIPAPVGWDKTIPAHLLELLPNVSYERSSQKQRALLLGKRAAGGAGGRHDAPELLTEGDGSSGLEPTRQQTRRRWDIADVFRASIADGIRPAEDDEVGPILKGLLLVATREIKDEELFLNYRLNPKTRRPEWYAPVDEEEDLRRWK